MATGDIAELRSALSYDKNTGNFTWLKSCGSVKAGDAATNVNAIGYSRVKIKGKSYLAHRLAWAFSYGEFPASTIDHGNGIKTDNRIENLRQATRSENQMNRRKHCDNTSGFKGVTWNAAKNQWSARCAANGKRVHVGYFNDAQSASFAYQQVAQQMHGAFYNEV